MGNKAEIIKRYTTYGSIISMSDQIGSKKELIQNIYLVLTKSIQDFLKALMPEEASSSSDLFEQLEENFAEYDAEKKIQIFYKLEQFENIIDSEDNEFIIIDKNFSKEFGMSFKKRSEQMVKLIRKENNFQIRLEGVEEKIILKQINNVFYKVDKIIYKEEENGEDNKEANNTQLSKNEINISQMNDNYTNEISNIISFLDCLKNITNLKKYFLENKIKFFSNESNKIYSNLFYNYLTTNSIEILIKNLFKIEMIYFTIINWLNAFMMKCILN